MTRTMTIMMGLLCALAAVGVSIRAHADDATLRVSIAGGAFNSKFKFFDASEGCPGYNDIPGAKDYLGSVFASDKGANKKLSVGQAVHVFLFRPKDTPGISAAGGPSEIRRRSLQVVLEGDATLRYTGVEDHVPVWESSGEVAVQPATTCESDDDEPAMDAENESEVEGNRDSG